MQKAWDGTQTRKLVTSELLGKARVPGLPYRLDTDYLDTKHSEGKIIPGPFARPSGDSPIKVYSATEK